MRERGVFFFLFLLCFIYSLSTKENTPKMHD